MHARLLDLVRSVGLHSDPQHRSAAWTALLAIRNEEPVALHFPAFCKLLPDAGFEVGAAEDELLRRLKQAVCQQDVWRIQAAIALVESKLTLLHGNKVLLLALA